MTPVTHYVAHWNIKTNKRHIGIQLMGSPAVIPLPVNTESEFAALVLMLSKQPVVFDPVTGHLELPMRLTGT
jgi:hypothetical protein